MNYSGRGVVTMGPRLTPLVKSLVIACVAAFILQKLVGPEMIYIFGLRPVAVLTQFFLWQLVTYLFLHGGFWHLLFNMFALWMFGSELERYLGYRQFLRFYLVTGVGAGILSVIVDPLSPIPTIGASGAIYGILMAYGMLFPNRMVYIYFLFPVKVKYFVAFLGLMAFLSALSAPGSQIAHVAHLGGMIFGYLFLKGWLSPTFLRQYYHRWRMRRLRRRFTVHESKKRDRDDDYWIH